MKQVRIFFTDLDGTVVGDNAGTARFRDFWQTLPEASRPLLVFNSGRLLDDQMELMQSVPLPEPDFIIGGVGTMLFSSKQPALSTDYTRSLGKAFDIEAIRSVMASVSGARIQPERYQHGLKSSWYLTDADEETLSQVENKLRDEGVQARIVYSSRRDLDILPVGADKGEAIRWLCNALGIGVDEALVAGDTGNDKAMFSLPGIRGIVVANALEELSSFASGKHNMFIALEAEADGVISGLKHWLSSPITQRL